MYLDIDFLNGSWIVIGRGKVVEYVVEDKIVGVNNLLSSYDLVFVFFFFSVGS